MEDNGRSILLVEDDPALALGLSDSLRFEGYRVVHTAKGEKAIELARSEAVDCVILDLMLPDMNTSSAAWKSSKLRIASCTGIPSARRFFI